MIYGSKKKSQEKYNKYIKFKEYENARCQHLWDTAKATESEIYSTKCLHYKGGKFLKQWSMHPFRETREEQNKSITNRNKVIIKSRNQLNRRGKKWRKAVKPIAGSLTKGQ